MEKGKKMPRYEERWIDKNALVEALLDYTWRDEEGFEIESADEKRQFIEQWLPDVPTVDAEPKWIPITSRPMDDEERIEWSEKLGYDIANDDGEALIYTSQLPDDGQEVLVCGRYGRVWIDTFMSDPDYGCYFEDNGDMDGIVAWMPLPKPYREKEREK